MQKVVRQVAKAAPAQRARPPQTQKVLRQVAQIRQKLAAGVGVEHKRLLGVRGAGKARPSSYDRDRPRGYAHIVPPRMCKLSTLDITGWFLNPQSRDVAANVQTYSSRRRTHSI